MSARTRAVQQVLLAYLDDNAPDLGDGPIWTSGANLTRDQAKLEMGDLVAVAVRVSPDPSVREFGSPRIAQARVLVQAVSNGPEGVDAASVAIDTLDGWSQPAGFPDDASLHDIVSGLFGEGGDTLVDDNGVYTVTRRFTAILN